MNAKRRHRRRRRLERRKRNLALFYAERERYARKMLPLLFDGLFERYVE